MSAEHPARGVVVGVDGSPGSSAALEWAVVQAVADHRPLVLLHAVQLLGLSQLGWLDAAAVDGGVAADLRREGDALLADAAAHAHRVAPDLEVVGVLESTDPRAALLAQGDRAAMIVLGSRGRGPVPSLLLGSVSVAVSGQAPCPVVVVRPGEPGIDRHGVVAAVFGDSSDAQVLRFAFRAASVRALPVTVVHCFWDTTHLGEDHREVDDDEAGLDDLRRLLFDAVAGARRAFPDVEDRLRLVRGFVDSELVRASWSSDLVVVGSHHPGALQDALYGSLARTVVEHADCPVAVVPTLGSQGPGSVDAEVA